MLGKMLVSVGLAAVIVAVAPLVAAAETTYTDHVTGTEVYATSTEGRFVGTATGSLPGTWYIDVLHTSLSNSQPIITGGTFDLTTILHGTPAVIEGSFVSGGTIEQTGGYSDCANQTYSINGSLDDVGPAGGRQNGTATFSATLTHYRISVFGSCITYGASISGSTTLTFPVTR